MEDWSRDCELLLVETLQEDLFGDAGGGGGMQQGQGRCGERYDPFLHLILSRGHGKPFQIIGLITCGADPMTAM